ncbi:MAG TPA: hypothetical protein PK450_02500 [Paracoccaceae bacterium]|nr:hypothetical protein [Paracoccaceae bacterium]
MLKSALVLTVTLTVAGCASWPAPSARPVAARLGGERLSVTFSDGQVCHAEVPMTGGAGHFADCTDRGDWQVQIRKRNLLEPLFGAAVSPYGRITVTGPTGRDWVFVTPLPNDVTR